MTPNLQIEFEKLAIVRGPLHPNYYNGSKGRSTKGPDYADRLADKLKGLGMVRGVHFDTGNDAKFHGHTGEWVKLTPVGRRRKVFQDIRAAAKIRRNFAWRKVFQGVTTAIQGSAKPTFAKGVVFDSWGQREIMQVWHDAGAVHPAPEEVLAIKLQCGASWKTIANRLEDA
jgi:hypothetical protein